MTVKESLELIIPMPKIYEGLTQDEKKAEIYKERLDSIILEVCTERYKLTQLRKSLFYLENYNIIKEKKFKESVIEGSEKLKKRFAFYKEEITMEEKTEIQLTEQMQEIMKDFDILSVEIDVNTADKLQSYFIKKEKDKTSCEIGPSKTSIAL